MVMRVLGGEEGQDCECGPCWGIGTFRGARLDPLTDARGEGWGAGFPTRVAWGVPWGLELLAPRLPSRPAQPSPPGLACDSRSWLVPVVSVRPGWEEGVLMSQEPSTCCGSPAEQLCGGSLSDRLFGGRLTFLPGTNPAWSWSVCLCCWVWLLVLHFGVSI